MGGVEPGAGGFAARLLAAIGQPVVVVDPEFRVLHLNRGAERVLGWSATEILGGEILSLAGVELSDERAADLLERLESGEELSETFELTTREGRRLPVAVELTPLLDEEGEFAGMVAAVTDVTVLQAMEDANSRLSAIVESSEDAIIGYDLSGQVTSWNVAAERLFRADADDRIGTTVSAALSSLVLDGEAGVELAVQSVTVPGTRRFFEVAHLRSDGSYGRVEIALHAVRDRHGTVVGGAAVCRDTTERHELEQRAALEHQRLEEAQRLAKLGSFDYDLVSGQLSWSGEFRRIVGVGDEEPASLEMFLGLVHEEDRQVLEQQVFERLALGHDDFEVTYRFRPIGGATLWLHTRGRAYRDASGGLTNLVGSIQDITDWVNQDAARRLAEEQFSVAFDQGNVGMLILGLDRVIVRANPTICRLLGRDVDEVVGATPDDFAHPDELADAAPSLTEQVLSSTSGSVECERRYLHADGEVVHAIVHASVVRGPDAEPLYVFAQVVDITDRKRAEEELERLAMQDPLPGLPNRHLLSDRLATALRRAWRTRAKVAVIFVDVDHFKLVNDSLGHSAGDELLRQLAHRLGTSIRAGDTVARFGGDEFVLVCDEVSDTAEAMAIGERVRRACDAPFSIAGNEMYVTVSSGIVVASEDDTPDTLLRDADTAMYRAKELGRARCELFDPGLRSRTTRRLDIEIALRRALEEHHFHLEYQPILRLGDGAPVSVEALIRWDHPERGTVAPAEFVPAAEDTGLIVPIGAWVVEEAIAQAARWRQSLPGAETLAMAVNLSPRQLADDAFLAVADAALSAHGLAPDALCLEITESAVMDDVDVSLSILRRIAERGISLAVDDFGAGYSSLGRLKSLPVNELKIDRSFVDGLGEDPHDSSIVEAIVSLAHALRLTLCAEGVETERQRAALVTLGCENAQGYLWSKPLRSAEFEVWYRSRLAAPFPVT